MTIWPLKKGGGADKPPPPYLRGLILFVDFSWGIPIGPDFSKRERGGGGGGRDGLQNIAEKLHNRVTLSQNCVAISVIFNYTVFWRESYKALKNQYK